MSRFYGIGETTELALRAARLVGNGSFLDWTVRRDELNDCLEIVASLECGNYEQFFAKAQFSHKTITLELASESAFVSLLSETIRGCSNDVWECVTEAHRWVALGELLGAA